MTKNQSETLSVIVTTFHRSQILKQNLLILISELQTSKRNWEIVIAIDQSDTDTIEAEICIHQNIRVVRGLQAGVSSSRNAALANCQNDIVIFLQDDVFIQTGCLDRHLDFHTQHVAENCVFQGLVIYDPNERNDFMVWLETGIQNDFLKHQSGFDTGVRWEAANSSMKRNFIDQHKLVFKESYVVFENLDFELQAFKKGARLFFDKQAVAFHRHPVTLSEYRNRMIAIGRFQRAYWDHGYLTNPDLAPFVPRSISFWTHWTNQLVLGLVQHARHFPTPIKHHLWYVQMTTFRMEGVGAALCDV